MVERTRARSPSSWWGRMLAEDMGVISKKPLPSLTLTDHRSREETFSASHKVLSSPRVPSDSKKIPPTFFVFLFLGLLETDKFPNNPWGVRKGVLRLWSCPRCRGKVEKRAEKCVQHWREKKRVRRGKGETMVRREQGEVKSGRDGKQRTKGRSPEHLKEQVNAGVSGDGEEVRCSTLTEMYNKRKKKEFLAMY